MRSNRYLVELPDHYEGWFMERRYSQKIYKLQVRTTVDDAIITWHTQQAPSGNSAKFVTPPRTSKFLQVCIIVMFRLCLARPLHYCHKSRGFSRLPSRHFSSTNRRNVQYERFNSSGSSSSKSPFLRWDKSVRMGVAIGVLSSAYYVSQ